MAVETCNDSLINGELETTDSSWHTICTWGIGSFSNHNYGILYGSIVAVCRTPDNTLCAFWDQPIAFICTDTDASLAGSLPSLIANYKPSALLGAGIDYNLDGESITFMVKGVASTTLRWALTFNITVGQVDSGS